MKITRLVLTNFRNHPKLKLKLEKNTCAIIGPNGAGKTNILEAINMLSTAKSFKAEYDKQIIRHGCDFCRVEADIYQNEEKTLLELTIEDRDKIGNASNKKTKINKIGRSGNKFSGIFNTVIFLPEDINLITDSPSLRRKYMDYVLFQTNYEYKKAHAVYTKALRQRNKLLELIKESGQGGALIDFWEKKMIDNAFIIQNSRKDLIEFLAPKIKENAKKVNNSNINIDIEYKINEMSQKRLEEHRKIDVAAKATLIGPHRDNLIIYHDGFDIASFGSRGQQRLALLALKLSEIDFITNKTGRRPTLLLDDIFSEFDDLHKKAIANIINLQQTIITSTDITNLKDKPAQIINL